MVKMARLPHRPVKFPIFFWPATLALAVPLALGLAGCSPSTNSADNNEAASDGASNSTVANASTTNGAVSNDAANSAVISATPSTQTPPRAALASVWVPGKDDKLHLLPVSKAALDVQKKFKDPTEAFNDLVRQSPNYFPPKTRVLDWHFDGKAVSLNFNRAFVDTNFWSKRGESRTELAVYALVNSASTSAGGTKSVVLEVEKSPIQSLGEMDTSDSIEPNERLQSKSGDIKSAGASANGSGASANGSGASANGSGASANGSGASANGGGAGRGEP
jgi:hypothetical protein